ncbi:hypothetical protein TVAG_428090 [Trichomonas vaginalis G3]|uniref:RIIa domain-containing protein n=1 Tax=Trichomonas vaginalis (strain ATCC PRA-98 / G3) TaxID=412133 RepID=A2G8H9_TRIV3|nr:Dimerization-anchoring domain of cAMP-dependent PK regulatory subunit family [Trichomonas vaginalis G3]EAX86542.1 hypothetical protein TVAG_428090 [Trichomonas vaginalis G3]KAI5483575.1 Dimerization-anchoring domain of cAMP-dependent PK regulatory subunit family [Trichomonas vaginalis G3]|eukprot:XP_001299472.1 hypothetical protein [Trichomonas vaginalis G3]
MSEDVISAPEEYSPQQRLEVKQYLESHPEIKTVIADLMVAIIENKPEKPLDFAKEYFENLK